MSIFEELTGIQTHKLEPINVGNIRTLWSSLEALELTINNLKDIKTAIDASNSISQESARFIETIRPGLLHSRLVLEQFTKHPSQIELSNTQKYLAGSIAVEETNLANSFSDFIKESLEDISQFIHHFDKYYKPLCETYIRELLTENDKLMSSYTTSSDLVIPWGDEFINLLNTPLHVLASAEHMFATYSEFLKDSGILSDLLSQPYVYAYVKSIVDGTDSKLIVPELDDINYRLILDMLTGTPLAKLDDIGNTIHQTHIELSNLAKQPDIDFNICKQQITDIINDLSYTESVMRSLNILYPACKYPMQYMNTLV